MDLDPAEGEFDSVREVALVTRQVFDAYGLVSLPVATGSKGFHVWVRLKPVLDYSTVGRVSHALARFIERAHPAVPFLFEKLAGRAIRYRLSIGYEMHAARRWRSHSPFGRVRTRRSLCRSLGTSLQRPTLISGHWVTLCPAFSMLRRFRLPRLFPSKPSSPPWKEWASISMPRSTVSGARDLSGADRADTTASSASIATHPYGWQHSHSHSSSRHIFRTGSDPANLSSNGEPTPRLIRARMSRVRESAPRPPRR